MWIPVNTYNSTVSANTQACHIRRGDPKIRAYRPTEHFEVDTVLTQDGADLLVRYVGPSVLPEVD